MPRARKDTEDEVPFYYVQLIDAENGKIRFGPFTQDDYLKSSLGQLGKPGKPTPANMAKDITDCINRLGLVTALTHLGIYGGLRVILKGDDGTDLPLSEVEAP